MTRGSRAEVSVRGFRRLTASVRRAQEHWQLKTSQHQPNMDQRLSSHGCFSLIRFYLLAPTLNQLSESKHEVALSIPQTHMNDPCAIKHLKVSFILVHVRVVALPGHHVRAEFSRGMRGPVGIWRSGT